MQRLAGNWPRMMIPQKIDDAHYGGSMASSTEHSVYAGQAGSIMIVDDNPANLKLLEEMLRQQAYEVRSFPRGRLALAAAENEPPDLILLDVTMPEMDGYAVCERLKSNATLSSIPVIFISALNATEDKIKGFQSGGVDYISKPFHFEEVHARVETHLKVRRAQLSENELLEKTLAGAVGALWELVQLISPVLASRSRAIQDIVGWITRRMGIKDSWQYELAARLCLLGCLSLPEEVFEKGYRGQRLSPQEDQMFRAHPESAARLLSKIPRLEAVTEMIRMQQKSEQVSSVPEEVRKGSQMLHLALQLDRNVYKGSTFGFALDQIGSSDPFDARMLVALKSYSLSQTDFEVRRLPIRELRASMILEEDLSSPDGRFLIFKKGTVLTDAWVERLRNFANMHGIQDMAIVRIPGLAVGNKRADDEQ
ncbi:MAG: response regulator [Terracidiphilus sp.]|jgi:response regulator RpfG family c-di-GMP phosphodiesterase